MKKGNDYVYVTTNPRKTVLYTGVTNDLKVRIRQHFGHKLIYYEYYFDINQAIAREKNINDMSKKKKEGLVASKNPYWNFLVI